MDPELIQRLEADLAALRKETDRLPKVPLPKVRETRKAGALEFSYELLFDFLPKDKASELRKLRKLEAKRVRNARWDLD